MTNKRITNIETHIIINRWMPCEDFSEHVANNALEELKNISEHIPIKLFDTTLQDSISVKISKYDDLDQKTKIKELIDLDNSKCYPSIKSEFLILNFSVIFEYDEKKIKLLTLLNHPDLKKISRNGLLNLIEQLTADDIYKIIMELLLCLNIAKPECLRIHDLYQFINNDLIKKIEFCSSICSYAEHLSSEPYSHKELALAKVWEWYRNIPDINEIRSNTALGRAIRAASYLLIKEEGEIGLIWALVGIEALYNNNRKNVREQIIDKSTQFLGALFITEDTLNEMYKFRSNFLHGKYDCVFFFR